ncbi:MAG: PBSX family phage terminase large subunit [Clostridia bacterium]|nr:PBSX family phage terminase large subunit [Clostridia bacterium]
MRRRTLNYRFSEKHREYLRKTTLSKYNIAEGSIRSGKTTDNVRAFAEDVMRSKDRIFLASASTLPTAKLIIGDCDGFGLEHIFRGQCRWGKFKGNEALLINGPDTNNKQKVILFCGGGKADSFKKIRGMTLGAWIATEINLHHPEFINEALKRQIEADRSKLYWDLNPTSPTALIYRNYIDEWDGRNKAGTLAGGFNYQQFNIFDNINLTPANVQAALSRYTPGTVEYIRDIEGKRCAAEGLIYKFFANHHAEFLCSRADVPVAEFDHIYIGQDFGGHKSHHTLVATGVTRDYKHVYVLKSETFEATDTDVDFVCQKLKEMADYIRSEYGRLDGVYADSAEQTIINTERARMPDLCIWNSIKNEINERISATNILICSGRLHFVENQNDSLIEGLRTAMWDETKDEDVRLDNFTTNICILDAFEYSWEADIAELTRW